jgi:hypothetical protein
MKLITTIIALVFLSGCAGLQVNHGPLSVNKLVVLPGFGPEQPPVNIPNGKQVNCGPQCGNSLDQSHPAVCPDWKMVIKPQGNVIFK